MPCIFRSVTFWSQAFPIFLHYKYTQFETRNMSDQESDAVFLKLHEKYAPVVEKLTLQLRGFYLKNAQLCSTRDEMLPEPYMRWAKKTQDDVPTIFAPGQAREIVARSLPPNVTFDQVFADWTEKPLGAASIGEVHRARLVDGQEVAVKVMFPGIERRFRGDLKTIIRFCELAMPQHVAPMKEIEKQFVTEFDYVGEAQNLLTVGNNLSCSEWKDKVVVPMPISNLCSKVE